MKNENRNPTPPDNESIHQWQKRFTLGKRKEIRELQKENAELERREIFRRKTAQASEKKAPYTLRTRAYYRFSKEYPSVVDENGFRADNRGVITPGLRRLTAVLCVLVFLLGLCGTKILMGVSQKPLPPVSDTAEQPFEPSFRALHFTYEELKEGNTEKMLSALNSANCNGAVFEYKDDKGYVMFNTGSFMGISADRRIKGAKDTVNTLKEKGIALCAYISCFKDSAASQAELAFAVRRNSSEGAAWLDNSGAGWLDPFSEACRNYLTDIISHAAADGFDRIILGNVCFPSDSGTAPRHYAWENSSSPSRNRILTGFIASAVKSSDKAKVTVMATYPAFAADAADTVPEYFGNLLSSAAVSFCLDARISVQRKNFTVGDDSFSDAGAMPFVFVLSASEYACKALRENARACEVLVCIEKGEKLEEQLSAVKFARADGYIIW